MGTIEWHEKELGTSEQSRLDAISRMRDLKHRGYVARVVYGNHMQFIVIWHTKPVKKYKPSKKLTGVGSKD